MAFRRPAHDHRGMSKPWACRLGLHRWEPAVSETGERYRHCERCGVDDDPASRVHSLGP